MGPEARKPTEERNSAQGSSLGGQAGLGRATMRGSWRTESRREKTMHGERERSESQHTSVSPREQARNVPTQCRTGATDCSLLTKFSLPPVSVNKKFLNAAMPFVWVLSLAAFVLQSRVGVVATETVCPAKP